MRHLAMTGMLTVRWMARIIAGSLARATPPSARICAGTRSSAITAQAPASSAMRACSLSTTSMITPPFSISARPVLVRLVLFFMACILSNDFDRLSFAGRSRRRACEPVLERFAEAARAFRQALGRLGAKPQAHAWLGIRRDGPQRAPTHEHAAPQAFFIQL